MFLTPKTVIFALVVILAIPILVAIGSSEKEPQHTIRSVTFESRREPPRSDIERIAGLGASHVTLIPFGFQQTPDTPGVRFNPQARWYTESDAGLETVSKWAVESGMKVIIKPHIWVGRYNGEGQWRDKITFNTDEDWAAWESAYSTFIQHYAALSERVGADIFVVGTELASIARERPEFWRRTIATVRTMYSGKLTYAANWWEEYEHVTFWDDLDFIGVQAYFPIYEGDETPDLAQLSAGWDRHATVLEQLSNEFDRPVLFTEIGYRSVSYAPARPWVWASRRNDAIESPDYDVQSDLYAALFETIWTQPWFAGAILWKWHASSERRSNETDFTPQNKPAEDLIRDNFLRLADEE
ncbi:MAG: glycoside hydrolase [Rhodothermales bacterium]|nr:glycoside hydrolase [Rhodothermales bacterium]